MASKTISALWIESDGRFAFHVEAPGAIEISQERYLELLNAQAKGQVLARGSDGMPVAISPPPPSAEQLTAQALSTRDGFLRVAALRIAPLQDAVDLGAATAAEGQLLSDWKRYRVQLNRIEQQAGFPASVSWPSSPAGQGS